MAQDFGNEWIVPSQTYVKFPIAKKGICRIYRDDLTPINNAFLTVNPRNIQVFARGKEQAIFISGESDLSFDSGDYIELYVEPNDGFLDKEMYKNPKEQNNPYYSLINDTIYYFITWQDSPTSKKRIKTYSSSDYNNYTSISSVKADHIYQYTSSYYWGERIAPYSSGKGWFDNQVFSYGHPVNKTLTLHHKISSSDVKVTFS